MKYSKGKQAKRGGTRAPDLNSKPVRSGTSGFTASAKKVHEKNRSVPMRGGIRL